MQSPKELDVIFPVRMNSQLKLEGQAAAELLGMNFSQFIRQAIERNIKIALEVDQEILARLHNHSGIKP